MRLSVDGFARLFSRKALLATAAVGAVALVALGAFSWKSNPPAAPPPPSRSSARRESPRSTSAPTCTA